MSCEVTARVSLAVGQRRGARVIARRAVEAALTHEGARARIVSVLLTDDTEMQRLNRQYRGIDKTTDVLSFPSGDDWLGDIVISLPQCERQAAAQGVPVRQELSRLAIHGTLHLLGRDHRTPAELRAMEELTEAILATLALTP